MSELINALNDGKNFRWQLLNTVSAVALLATVYGAGKAKAEDQDADRPTVWIELGGELEHVGGQGYPFTPGFLAANPASPVLQSVTPVQAQNPSPFGFGENGKISFQPEDTNWVFSGAVNFGRSSNNKKVDHQTNGLHYEKYTNGVHSTTGHLLTQENFAKTVASHQASYVLLDFSAGKDLGLGVFGRDGSSTLDLGVRFAQFASKEKFDVRARPDLKFRYFPSATAPTRFVFPYFHTYHFSGSASRSFQGIGPSLSWNASAPVVGNAQDNEVSIDWGINAAILFGRQKARVRHQETGHYVSPFIMLQHPTTAYTVMYQRAGEGHSTDRSVIVPNVGGFAGATYRIENFKVSLGYRADFFFGAMDEGVDVRKSENVGFYGPFASVSVGLGG